MTFRTDYFAHDARYRQQRNQGAAGWDTDDVSRERSLSWALHAMGAPGRRLLELGCGAGNAAKWFTARGFEFTGVDISPTAVAWAEERGHGRFVVGDVVEAIDGTYDVIIDGHCLHCIIGADRARLLENVWSALTPGGWFFVATMCGAVTIPALRACFDETTRCQVVDGVAYRFIGDADEILTELRDAGFEIVSSTIDPRKSDDDQDHLWAIARRP